MKKFCSHVLESVFKLSELLTSNIVDSIDKNVIKCVFYEDCEVCSEDDEDNKDNKDDKEDSEDTDCKESS